METRANYVAVGVFVLVLLVGLTIVALWLAHGQFAKPTTRYETYFSSIGTGLTPGSPVRVNGVQVGTVASVDLDPADPTRVRVIVDVNPNAPIRSDSIASVEIQSLTGTAAIEISAGKPSAPPIAMKEGQAYPVIWSRESNLDLIVNTVPLLMAKFNRLADQLNTLLAEPNQEAIASTLDNLRQVTSVAAAHSADLGRLMSQGADDAKDLDQAINSLTTAAHQLQGVADEANTTMRNINGVVEENRGPLRQFSQTGLAQIEQLVTQTQGLVGDLRRTVDELNRNPTSLIYGDQRQGYRPK